MVNIILNRNQYTWPLNKRIIRPQSFHYDQHHFRILIYQFIAKMLCKQFHESTLKLPKLFILYWLSQFSIIILIKQFERLQNLSTLIIAKLICHYIIYHKFNLPIDIHTIVFWFIIYTYFIYSQSCKSDISNTFSS